MPFRDGRSMVMKQRGSDRSYIDKTGKEVLNPVGVNQSFMFSENLLRVQFEMLGSGLKWGYMDKNGELVIPARYDDAGDFNQGIARVMVDDKFGFIDRQGKWVIELKYDNATDFYEGFAAVLVGRGWGYINRSGKLVVKPLYLTSSGLNNTPSHPFSEGLASVETENGFGFIDTTGAMVIPAQFEFAFHFS